VLQADSFGADLVVGAVAQSRVEPVSLPGASYPIMDLDLKGKTALVTGSTAGIGLAIVTALAKEGAVVIVNGRTQERVDRAVAISGATYGVAADLGTETGARTVIERFPAVDILVNNLGIFEPKPFEEIPDDDWRRFFEVNVLSGVRMSRHYIGPMKQKNWGRIVFISSESALQIPKEMIHYGMTKTAQIAVARGLAETTKGTGVTVNSVLPGPTKSEGVAEFVGKLASANGVDTAAIEREFFSKGRPSSLLQRFATSEEVASVVAFVCSPLASAINGSAVRAEGGVVQSIA
jgi:NAD(P)-dependent dehydrogenase (short-subunit alcohol dehydrogenase family)